MSPVVAFDIAVVAQKVQYRGPVWSGGGGGGWISSRTGWLLELLTEVKKKFSLFLWRLILCVSCEITKKWKKCVFYLSLQIPEDINSGQCGNRRLAFTQKQSLAFRRSRKISSVGREKPPPLCSPCGWVTEVLMYCEKILHPPISNTMTSNNL